MKNLDRMSPRKREFMVKVVHIIATSSYLAGAMKGAMPEDVKKIVASHLARLDSTARV